MNENISYRYRNRLINNLVGVVSLIMGILELVFIIFLVFFVQKINVTVFVLMIVSPWSIYAGIKYLRMDNYDFLVIDNNGMSISRGIAIPRKYISFDDIKDVKISRNYISIKMNEGKGLKLDLKNLTVENVVLLNETLDKRLA